MCRYCSAGGATGLDSNTSMDQSQINSVSQQSSNKEFGKVFIEVCKINLT
ncbi:MAG: hypothetical protein ACJA2S_005054 [Cyclobacteriaceae bacterium]|jgi:hypothetical protein